MSFFSDVERELVVVARDEVAKDVVSIALASPNGRDLPEWSPGSHIDLILPGLGGTGASETAESDERQYSLCGDAAERAQWRIAVLREDAGRGGSVHVHDRLAVGDRIRVRGPRNHFWFDAASTRPAHLVAGGIGITAIRPMIDAADAAGREWSLDYAGRSPEAMAFAEELARRWPERVRLHAATTGARLDVTRLVSGLDADADVYACGPARLLDALELGLADTPAQLHVERFTAKEFGAPVWQGPFEVELAMSGDVVTVAPDQSVLEAIQQQSPETIVLSSCRRGTCGTCEVPVIEGDIEHRDSVLIPGEQEDSAMMMVCVSRAACPRIVLDL